jgi:hypothetical protein
MCASQSTISHVGILFSINRGIPLVPFLIKTKPESPTASKRPSAKKTTPRIKRKS